MFRKQSFNVGLLFALALMFTTSFATAQNSLYRSDGLMLFDLEVQKKIGANRFVTVQNYDKGQTYRVRVRFANKYGDQDIRVSNIELELYLDNAAWTRPIPRYRFGRKFTFLKDKTWNQGLSSKSARWFNFGEFTWNGNQRIIESTRFKIGVNHMTLEKHKGEVKLVLPN